MIRLALGGNGKGQGKPIDLNKDIARLTRADFEGLANYWWSKERSVSERTAGNYLRTVMQFVEWLDTQKIGFEKAVQKAKALLGKPGK